MSSSASLPDLRQNIRIAIVEGGGHSPREIITAQSPLRIGRPDPANFAHAPELNLAPDLLVSREHARLEYDGKKLRIEDLESRHGTTIAGKQIRGLGAVDLPFGAPVRIGGTTFVAMPAHWWHVQFEDLSVCAPYTRVVNYAAHHCGTPVVPEMTIANLTRETLPPPRFRLQIPGFTGIAQITDAGFEPEEYRTLRVPMLAFDPAKLRGQVEPVRTALRLEMELPRPETMGNSSIADRTIMRVLPSDATQRIMRAECEVVILGFWDWSFEPQARKTIAAFVTPRNPAVERLVTEAQSHATSSGSFRELMRSGNDHAEREILRSIYDELSRRNLRYEDPRLQTGSGKDSYQTIRSPHRIFPQYPASNEGRATCIDLALLFAGCLENSGLCPLIIFLGAEDGLPRHALAGVWMGATPGARPVVEDSAWIVREIRTGRLLVVEGTGVTADAASRKLAFTEAVAKATERIAESKWVCAVDVCALRPPSGTITPIENAYEPEVARVYDESRRLAALQGAKNLEMTHLFCALIIAGGDIVTALCSKLGVDPAQVRRRLETAANYGQGIPGTVPTHNVLECQQLAQNFARDAGSPSVREQDLIWAILQKAPLSNRLNENARILGIDLERFRALLEQDYPSPIMASTGAFSRTYTML